MKDKNTFGEFYRSLVKSVSFVGKDNPIRVEVPFRFQDGDLFVIYVEETEEGTFVLSDRGHTLMRISFESEDIVFPKHITDSTLKNISGELIMKFQKKEDFATALFTFCQFLSQVEIINSQTRRLT